MLEDSAGNRVLLDPESAVAAYVGSTVTITGRFSVDASIGRTLSVQSVSP